jgi:hypothetical protein
MAWIRASPLARFIGRFFRMASFFLLAPVVENQKTGQHFLRQSDLLLPAKMPALSLPGGLPAQKFKRLARQETSS